jgi:hypothetical protein
VRRHGISARPLSNGRVAIQLEARWVSPLVDARVAPGTERCCRRAVGGAPDIADAGLVRDAAGRQIPRLRVVLRRWRRCGRVRLEVGAVATRPVLSSLCHQRGRRRRRGCRRRPGRCCRRPARCPPPGRPATRRGKASRTTSEINAAPTWHVCDRPRPTGDRSSRSPGVSLARLSRAVPNKEAAPVRVVVARSPPGGAVAGRPQART